MSYYQKYLKYKSKYFTLLSTLSDLSDRQPKGTIKQKGGDKALINDFDSINLFKKYPKMEPYLNPIYGLFICGSGYISNNYFLHKAEYIRTPESTLIANISRAISGSVQPNRDIMKLKPIDFGRHIGLKFILKSDIKFITKTTGGEINLKSLNGVEIDPEDRKNILEYIKKINKYIPKNYDNQIHFHILLYCFWWVANNDQGIQEYYIGINEVFNIANKYLQENLKFPKLSIDSLGTSAAVDQVQKSFEEIIYELANEPFKIYTQEQSKHFCTEANEPTYPDCGETTARNLINILCYDGTKFNIEILGQFNPIPQLVEYYTVFNNFGAQSNPELQENIYADKLNARDAWSKIIMHYANHNIKFSDTMCNCDMDGGLSLDGNTTNFLQLIKNLLPGFKDWDQLVKSGFNSKILEIDDQVNMDDGVGKIYIKHEVYENFIIHCEQGHYHVENIKNPKIYNYAYLSSEQKNKIEILLKKEITIDNYLWIQISSEELVELLENPDISNDLKLKLIDLAMTDKYDRDAKRRVFETVVYEELDPIITSKLFELSWTDKCDSETRKNIFFKKYDKLLYNKIAIERKLKKLELDKLEQDILEKIKLAQDKLKQDKLELFKLLLTDKYDDYTRDFMEIDVNRDIEYFNLIKNCEDTSKQNGFRYKSNNFNFIRELNGLTHLNFNIKNKDIKSIDLSPLANTNIISIGNYFLRDCEITSIDLSPLVNIISIGDGFLENCESLISIDLRPLVNIISIGDDFMNECYELTEIKLSDLPALKKIGNNFLFKCYIEKLSLFNLPTLRTIGNRFLAGSYNLKEIKLFNLQALTIIGTNFLNGCTQLLELNLSNLSSLRKIGYGFMFEHNKDLVIKCTEYQASLISQAEYSADNLQII